MIPYGRHSLDEDDIAAVVRQLRDRTLTQGAAVDEFEQAVARYLGVRYAVAVSSGTAALHVACAAAGLGPGDNVLTSAITFVASANCARYVGANAAFVDIDPRTVNMDPADLERRCRALGSVAAIIPVHFAGLSCDMPAIRALAVRHGAKVIEDASHALGGRHADGSRIGSCAHSDMTVLSFHPVKQITTGEGGMITTNDGALYRDLLRLRSHGINKGDDPLQLREHAQTDGRRNRWYYEMQELGFNYRLTEIQAALGLSQLGKLERFLERRRALVSRYDAAFRGDDRLRPAQTSGRDTSGHHLYVIRARFGKDCVSRNELMQRLYDAGYITQVHYIPVPLHPYYQKLGHRASDFPNAWAYYLEALSIPLFFSLTDEEQNRFVDDLRRLIR
jgi:UDP-4-amino-4,6-dideoxy-N-acetyl-beta-L-altrosamine transaminase